MEKDVPYLKDKTPNALCCTRRVDRGFFQVSTTNRPHFLKIRPQIKTFTVKSAKCDTRVMSMVYNDTICTKYAAG